MKLRVLLGRLWRVPLPRDHVPAPVDLNGFGLCPAVIADPAQTNRRVTHVARREPGPPVNCEARRRGDVAWCSVS